jgi:hypothetical protein
MVDLLFTALCTSLNQRFTCSPRAVSTRIRAQGDEARRTYDVHAGRRALHEVHARDESGASHVGLAVDNGLLEVALGLAQHSHVVDLAEHPNGVGPIRTQRRDKGQ